MPKALYRFKAGGKVFITCYHPGCENVFILVTLGQEYEIHSSFVQGGRVGRFYWNPNTVVRGFELGRTLGGSGYCNCLNCHTLFGSVIIISNGRGKKPTIIGYDPEPA